MTDLFDDRKARAAGWFRDLRDEIVAAFEALEDERSGSGQPGRFEVTPTTRPDGGGDEETADDPACQSDHGVVPAGASALARRESSSASASACAAISAATPSAGARMVSGKAASRRTALR